MANILYKTNIFFIQQFTPNRTINTNESSTDNSHRNIETHITTHERVNAANRRQNFHFGQYEIHINEDQRLNRKITGIRATQINEIQIIIRTHPNESNYSHTTTQQSGINRRPFLKIKRTRFKTPALPPQR